MPEITHGQGETKYGPGVDIKLTGKELVLAITTYLTAHDIHIAGARTFSVNGSQMCRDATVHVDPAGSVYAPDGTYRGSGGIEQ